MNSTKLPAPAQRLTSKRMSMRLPTPASKFWSICAWVSARS